jgi:hypothetical protein
MVENVSIPVEIIDRHDFISLTGAAILVLLLLAGAKSTGGIRKLTYEDTKTDGLTHPRFSRAIKTLVQTGFIRITHRGGNGPGDCNEYQIRGIDYEV